MRKFLFYLSIFISYCHLGDMQSVYALSDIPKGWRRHPVEYYVWKTQAVHIKYMEEKYKYQSFLVSSWWGKKIDSFRMYYEGQEERDIASTRHMIVESTEWYLHYLNQNSDIQELLANPPFTVEQLQLRWTFRQLDNDRLFIRGGHIAMATLRDGKITYEIYDEDKKDLVVAHSETYQEAIFYFKD